MKFFFVSTFILAGLVSFTPASFAEEGGEDFSCVNNNQCQQDKIEATIHLQESENANRGVAQDDNYLESSVDAE